MFIRLAAFVNLPETLRLSGLTVSLVFLVTLNVLAQRTSPRNRVSFGQSVGVTSDTTFLDVDQDIAVQLMPFDDLVRLAVASSPLIKYQNELIRSVDATRDLAKGQILQNASGFVNYSAGNQSLLTTGLNQRGDVLGQIANGYRVGLDLRISLYDLFGRKHLLKQAEANLRATVVQKDVVELQLRREMIVIYQDMITTQQVLKHRLTDEQSALAALRIAEVENQKGQLTSEQLATATNRYIESKVVTEQVKGDFLKNVHQFEALVGLPIQSMKRF